MFVSLPLIGFIVLAGFFVIVAIGGIVMEAIVRLRANIEAALARLKAQEDYDTVKAENVDLKAEIDRLNVMFDQPFKPSDQ